MPDSTIGITPLTPQSAFPGDMSAFNPANNRIQTSGFSYLDGAGNLTGDPSTGSQAMVYDGENRLIKYTKNGETQYSYDGDGHRVKKYDVNENVTTVFVYNAGGQLIAEYTNSTEPPAGGGGTSYLTTDHLGSTRVVTRADGSVKARYDYLPFGEDLGANVGQRTTGMGYSGDDATRQKFTQKERDNESGLDYFLARYYSSAQGRFTSPDEFVGGPDELYYFAAAAAGNPTFYSDLANPQSLNKYQYCYNNPLRYVDPDGHILETLWDVANALMGAASFAKNAKEGNVGAAIVDGLGVVVDVAAAVVPFVPGGVGTVIKVARGAENVVDAVQTADKVVDVAKAVDKVDDTKSIVNTGGRFGDLNKTKGADEVAHHIPQDALNRTTTGLSRADGPALGMTKADHALTNTFAGRGVKALREGLELTARQVVARDVRNVRSIAKSQHGNIRHYNQGLLQMIGYAKTLGPF
jgi:RHS repeat-associated protein